MEEVRVREPTERDMAFVLDSWVKSSGDFPRGSKRDWVLRELAREGTRVLVASFDEDPSLVLGWLATRGDECVLYVYVKLNYRGSGIAGELLGERLRTKQRVQHLPRGHKLPNGWTYDRWM